MQPTHDSSSAEPTLDVFPLDDAAIETLAELDQQERAINVSRNAILGYFLRQHKVTGNWRVADNRRELVRIPPPAEAKP